MRRKISVEDLALAVRPTKEEEIPEPEVALKPEPKPEPEPTPAPRPRRAIRPLRLGHHAWRLAGSAWDLFLLALFIGIAGLAVWLVFLLEPHLPALAHSGVGQWIRVIGHWETGLFARVPAPTKGVAK